MSALIQLAQIKMQLVQNNIGHNQPIILGTAFMQTLKYCHYFKWLVHFQHVRSYTHNLKWRVSSFVRVRGPFTNQFSKNNILALLVCIQVPPKIIAIYTGSQSMHNLEYDLFGIHCLTLVMLFIRPLCSCVGATRGYHSH